MALDISVRSTGWVKWFNKQLTYGTYSLQSTDERERRREFGAFLQELIGFENYAFVAVEDVIFGNNFKTTKGLVQLNVVVETLMDYNQIATVPIKRIGNTVWKRTLYRIAGETAKLVGDDKECVRAALHAMGFNVQRDKAIVQDIYDAMGLALACIVEEHSEIEDIKDVVIKKQHTSLYKAFKLKQYPNEDGLLLAVMEKSKRVKKGVRPVVWLRDSEKYKVIDKHFQDVVQQNGDNCIFAIAYNVEKVGALLLYRQFDSSLLTDKVYFMAYL